MSETFYDTLAPIYDRMIRWESRMKFETPLFADLWARYGTRRVLDAACGSGHHLRLFCEQGLEATGADASQAMLDLARQQIEELPEGRRPALVQAVWSELPGKVSGTFDAVVCVGNSLPYVTEADALHRSLEGLWACVEPGGFLLIQFKNFAGMRARGEQFLPLSAGTDPSNGREVLCLRIYEWDKRIVNFKVVLLRRGEEAGSSAGGWTMDHWTTPLATYGPADVIVPLEAMGAATELYGSLAMDAFDPVASPDVVILACRPGDA